MKWKSSLAGIGIIVLLLGCATEQINRLKTDEKFNVAALSLAKEYLDGQMQGESDRVTLEKYGTKRGFINLQEYYIEGTGRHLLDAAIHVQVKVGDRAGETGWRMIVINLRHDPKIETAGDKYMGLRIHSVETYFSDR